MQRPLWTAQILLCLWTSVELRVWLRAGKNGAGQLDPDLEVDTAERSGGPEGLWG